MQTENLGECHHCGTANTEISAFGSQQVGEPLCTTCTRQLQLTWDPPHPDDALTFDEVEQAGLDGSLRF